MWETIQAEVDSPVELSLHEELIHDAVVYRSEMRYQLAALFAAIAVEVMLRRTYSVLLRHQGKLRDKQIDRKVEDARFKSLLGCIKDLDSSILILDEEIAPVVAERNSIAHGKSHDTDPILTAKIIHTAQRIKSVLDHLTDP